MTIFNSCMKKIFLFSIWLTIWFNSTPWIICYLISIFKSIIPSINCVGHFRVNWIFGCLLCNCNFSAFVVSLFLLQVRTKLSSLEGIVPASHGFMIGSTGMKNVWLSMDHQSILWCNQLVVQVHWSKYIYFLILF